MKKHKTLTFINLLFLGTLFLIQNAVAQQLDNLSGPILYNQTSNIATVSQYSSIYYNVATGTDTVYGTSFPSASVMLADDFAVPTGASWDIYSVKAMGESISQTSSITGIDVVFYTNATKKPGTIIQSFNNITNYLIENGDLLIYLPQKLTLSQGNYWVGIAVTSDKSLRYYWKWNYYNVYDTVGIAPTHYKFINAAHNSSWLSMIDKYAYHNTDLSFNINGAYTNDLAILEISTPNTGELLGMGTVSVKIKNIGQTAQSNFGVKYSDNGGAEVVETVSGTIQPGETLIHTFTTQCDLSVTGNHELNVTVVLPADNHPENDSSVKNVWNYGTVYRISDYENQTITACEGTFTDAGGLTSGTVADTLITTFSPGNTSNRIQLTFAQFTIALGDSLFIYDGVNEQSELIGSFSGTFSPGEIQASNTTGSLTIKFKGKNASSFTGWIATVSCKPAPNNDLGITKIISPITGADKSALEDIAILIKNYGLNAKSDLNVSYTIVGDNQVSSTVNETINAIPPVLTGEYYTYVFTQKADLHVAQNYNVTATVTSASDEVATNNSQSITVENYGTVYNILTFNNDTIKACDGVFVDEGGIEGNQPTEKSYTTIIKSDDLNKRVKLTFIEFAVGYDGKMKIYDGINNKAPLIGQWSYSQLTGEISSANEYGTLFIEFTSSTGNFSGWRAVISCYTPLVDDFSVNKISFSKSPGYLDVLNKVYVQVHNKGSLAQQKQVKLTVNDTIIETLLSGSIMGGVYDTMQFNWTPTAAGKNIVKVDLIDADDNLTNNSLSTNVDILSSLSLTESFEGDVFPPEGWIAGATWDKRVPSFASAPDGTYTAGKLTYKPYIDTLYTPVLDIKQGDVLKLSIASSGLDGGYLQAGYWDSGVFKKIPFEVYLGYNVFKDHEMDLSSAIGVRRIALLATSELHIDKILGPALYVEDKDIEVLSIETARVAVVSDTSYINVSLKNNGGSLIGDSVYSVSLYKKGTPDFKLTSIPGIELKKLETRSITIPYVFKYEGIDEVFVTVDYTLDINHGNDTSEVNTIDIFKKGSVIVAIGSETIEDAKLPMAMGSNYSVSQVLYTKNQIGNVGKISALTYYYDFEEAQSNVQTKIYMASTSKADLSASWINASEFTLVYDGVIDFMNDSSSVYIRLSTPFTLSNQNLVVMVYKYDANTYQSQRFIKSSSLVTSAVTAVSSTPIDINQLPVGLTSKFYPNIELVVDSKAATISGTIIDQYGKTIDVAKVQLDGYEAQTIYSSNGKFQFNNIIANKSYTITASAAGYEKFITNTFMVDSLPYSVGQLKLSVIEIPFAVIATRETDKNIISWKHETLATFEAPIYINETLEKVYAAPANSDMWAGNLIPVTNPGTLVGAYVWAVNTDPFSNNSPITIEVLDKTFKTIAVSEQFRLPDQQEIFIEMPYVSYNEDFYLMVHWVNLSTVTNLIGLDTDSDHKYGFIGNPEDGFVDANGSFTVLPAMLVDVQKAPSKTFKGYDLYRGLQSDMENVSGWTKINNVPIKPVNNKVTYYDYGWAPDEKGIYMYAVRSLYDRDSSAYVYSNLVKYKVESAVTVSIKSNNIPVENAMIELVNNDNLTIHEYSAVTNVQGLATIPVVECGTYTIVVKHADFDRFELANQQIVNEQDSLNYNLEETIVAPKDLKVQLQSGGDALVSWNGYGESKQLIIDDASYENGLWINGNNDLRLGNLFENNYIGQVVSVDIYGLTAGGQEILPVTIDIYSSTGELLGTSNTFTIPAYKFLTVQFDAPVDFEGDFFAMVHWDNVGDTTNVLPLDLDGEYAGRMLAYIQSDEEGFFKLGELDKDLDGVFAIRPSILIKGYTADAKSLALKSGIVPAAFKSIIQILNNPKTIANVVNSKSLRYFNIYLDNLNSPYAQNVNDLFYLFEGLSLGSHQVGVSAQYNSGESEIITLNFDVTVGASSEVGKQLEIFPNPTNDVVNIKNGESFDIAVYNVAGVLLETKNVTKDSESISLKQYGNGTYFIVAKNANIEKIFKVLVFN